MAHPPFAMPLARGYSITASFDVAGGPPVVHKVAAYNSGLVPLARYERDLSLVAALNVAELRVDVGLGWNSAAAAHHLPGIWGDAVLTGKVHPNATCGGASYNTSAVVALHALLRSYAIQPLYAIGYVPPPLQSVRGDWTSPPIDVATCWREMHGALLRPIARTTRFPAAAAAAADGDFRVEMYNEPDLIWAFTGDWNEYLAMYRAGVHGVVDAVGNLSTVRVVGPAAAIGDVALLAAFIRNARAAAESAATMAPPLDALTLHTYGNRTAAWEPTVQRGRAAIAAAAAAPGPGMSGGGASRSLGIELNEFNVLPTDAARGGYTPAERDAILNGHRLAPLLLRALAALLHFPDVTRIHWAQTMDSGAGDHWGLIDEAGHAKASYNAMRLWTMLPATALAGGGGGGGASARVGGASSAGSNASRVVVTAANAGAAGAAAAPGAALEAAQGGAASDGGCAVEGIASANGTTATLLVWCATNAPPPTTNVSSSSFSSADAATARGAAVTVSVELNGLPAFGGRAAFGTRYEITSREASIGDNASSEFLIPHALNGGAAVVRGEPLRWSGELCEGCVLAFVVHAKGGG